MTADALFGLGAVILSTFNLVAIIDTRVRIARMTRGPIR